jgi:hypothetical protein
LFDPWKYVFIYQKFRVKTQDGKNKEPFILSQRNSSFFSPLLSPLGGEKTKKENINFSLSFLYEVSSYFGKIFDLVIIMSPQL